MKPNRFILLGILVITGCTPMIQVRVLRPPQANIKNIQNVAVIDLISVAVEDPKIIQKIRRRLVDKLKKHSNYKYLDPENIDLTLEKEKFKKEDYQDIKYARQVGRILGVDTLIYGTVIAYHSSDEVEHIRGEPDPFTGERLFQDRLKFIRVVDVAIKFNIVPVDGEKHVNKTLYAKIRSDEKGFRDGFAKEALEPEENLFKKALDEVIESLVKLIAHHYVEEDWPLKEGEHPELRKGIDYAIQGQWDQAGSSWEAVLAEKDSSPADRYSASFNLGLLAESEGKTEEAAKIFQELDDNNNDSGIQEILERIKKKRNIQKIKPEIGE